jgi:hypothetical protein
MLSVASNRPPLQRRDLNRCWSTEVRRKQILGEHDGVIDIWANGQDEPDGYAMQAGSEVPTNGLGHRRDYLTRSRHAHAAGRSVDRADERAIVTFAAHVVSSDRNVRMPRLCCADLLASAAGVRCRWRVGSAS